MTTQAPAILARNLSKTFPDGTQAVSALDIAVAPGSFYGLVGANGAGKTTALRLLMGLLRPSSGTAEVLGQDLWRAGRLHRQRIAYVSQEQRLHDWMSLAELCQYLAHFYTRWDSGHATLLARRFELPMERQVGLLSGGQQRLAALLLALAARPEVLVLDEPAAGLDPMARRMLLDALIEVLGTQEQGLTVILSTHILSDLERVADHIGIMDRGRLSHSSALSELQVSMLRIQLIFPDGNVPPDFAIPGALRPQIQGPVYQAVVRQMGEEALSALAARLGARLQVFPLGLEDIVIELTARPLPATI